MSSPSRPKHAAAPTTRWTRPRPTSTALPGKSRTGRQTALTPHLQEQLCALLREGNYLSVACAQLGQAVATVEEWIERGRNADTQRARTRGTHPVYATFAKAVEKAQAEGESARVARIQQAGQGGAVLKVRRYRNEAGEPVEEEERARPQWQADAWYLERRHPERWGRKETVKQEHDLSDSMKALLASWEPVVETQRGRPTGGERPPWEREQAEADEEDD